MSETVHLFLKLLTNHVTKRYLFFSHELEKHNLKLQLYLLDERDELGYYFCRNKCGLVLSTKSTRNRCVMSLFLKISHLLLAG